ncbi:T9SS type A sorting domain-containing protein [Hymenobacter chitinivorans]|uniref:Putative secreted protein (Por secretion system target) n=1 Tax=Hymenobacter chitinivorans DSM 11115 TaxID=1121954 RepID=A0A2M9AQC1_9BACT|nr:T9SS type A sorting domain-containing protein [Hymenobacter chitinivorans]PJJ47888.1 putative secreted protein (Por secretion system target) [Hymenobacter chitinivorans DSM 11115]
MRIVTLLTGLLLGTTFGASAQVATPTRQLPESRSRQLLHAAPASAAGSAPALRHATSLSQPGRAVHHSWNSTNNSWTKATVETYAYDAQGRLTQEAVADSATQAPLYRSLYSYNGQGLNTEEVYQTWSGTAWLNTGRYAATYDARGSITEALYQEWTGSAWLTNDGNRYQLTYNSAGVLLTQVVQDFDMGTFVNSQKLTYSVSTNNEWTSMVEQRWEQGAWQDQARFTYTWHNWSKRQYATVLQETWQGQWQPATRFTYVFGANDSFTVTAEENVRGGSWQNFFREKLTYDAQHNNTEYTSEEWLNNAWSLEYGERTTRRYASTGELLRLLTQVYEPSRTASYVNSDLYTYSAFVLLSNTGPAARNLAAEIYPNPTTGLVTLRWNGAARSAAVLNLLGQTVRTVPLPAGATTHALDLSALPAGVYSIRLQTAAGSVTQRLVKQ